MRDRRGFTLIELMAVITIIGILASLALPRYTYIKQRAYIVSMISDLRNLATTQESFWSSYGAYAGGITAGAEIPGIGGTGRASFVPSPDVSITVSWYAAPGRGEGWSAVATHPKVTDPSRDQCGIFIGHPSYSPNAAVTQSGLITCY